MSPNINTFESFFTWWVFEWSFECVLFVVVFSLVVLFSISIVSSLAISDGSKMDVSLSLNMSIVPMVPSLAMVS